MPSPQLKWSFIITIALLSLMHVGPVFAEPPRLILDGQVSVPTNNSGDSDAPRAYPIVLFTMPKLGKLPIAARFLTAGIFNSARFAIDQGPKEWSFFWEDRFLYKYAGTAPVIDGDVQQQYQFNSNLFSNTIGAQNTFDLFGLHWRGGARYDLDWYMPYGDTDPTVFVRPDQFIEQGPSLFIEARDLPPIELLTYGILPQIKIEQKFRHGLSQWGPVGNETQVEQYFRVESVNNFGIPVSKHMIVSGRLFGGYVSSTDLYNAIKFGSMISLGPTATTIPGPGMYSSEVNAHWIAGGTIGPRILLDREAKAKMALRPFFHGAMYNEITSTTRRHNKVGGVGISLMGHHTKRFFWEVAYANVFGLERQSQPSNEFYLHLSWVAWQGKEPS